MEIKTLEQVSLVILREIFLEERPVHDLNDKIELILARRTANYHFVYSREDVHKQIREVKEFIRMKIGIE